MKILGLSGRNWKCFFAGLILAWISGCAALWTYGGVPVKFTVETSRADVFEHSCFHGETLDFEVTYKSYGKDLYIPTNYEAQIFWQTNGMSAFFWRTNTVTCVSNKMYTTFLPSMDPGMSTVFGFIGVPGEIYRASFVLRFKNSPGAKPKEMEWPYRELDFNKVEMLNEKWYRKEISDAMDAATKGWASNAVPELVNEALTNRNLIIIGKGASTGGNENTAIGKNAKAESVGTTSIGNSTKATGSGAMAVGQNSEATGSETFAMGYGAKARGNKSIAVGKEAETGAVNGPNWDLGINAVAIGVSAKARRMDDVAIGREAVGTNGQAMALGAFAYANGGVAIGWKAEATALGATAIGRASNYAINGSTGARYWVEGSAKARGSKSIAIGGMVEEGCDKGIAIGYAAMVSNSQAVVISTANRGDNPITGSHGNGTITLGVENSDPQKVYIGNKTLKKIVEENGIVTETDPTVSSWAKAETKPTYSAEEVGAYPETSGNLLAQQVATQGAHLNAEDAQFVSTNYDSTVHMPEAYVRIKLQQGGTNVWQTIWEEMRRWNAFMGIGFNWQTWGGFHTWSTNMLALINETSPKEYAFYDGTTGEVAPDGFFWISQPRIAICAGASYQRHLDAGGAVWILESNGLVANIGGTTNGYFRISDEEGNTQFEIIKGDKQTVPAIARSVRSEQVMGVTHWICDYAVTNALAAPTAKFCRSLSNPTWIADTEASCPCNVTWTPGVNTYTLEFWPKTTEPTMFCKSEYDRGGETRIRQAVPTEMQYIILNGTKYGLTPKTINGELVMGLTTGN